MASYPARVSWGAARLDIFHMTQDRWKPTPKLQRLPVELLAESRWAARRCAGDVQPRQRGYMNVGVKGTDGQAWHRPYNNSDGWSSWEPLGGNVTHDPGMVSRGQDSMDAFVSWLLMASAGVSRGATPLAGPSGRQWAGIWIALRRWSRGADHMEHLLQGQDGQAWWKKWSRWTWDSWVSLGGSVVGTPSAFAVWLRGNIRQGG